jgi:hypothetical protein
MAEAKEIKGKTVSGFAYKIKASALNDAELLDILVDLEDNYVLLPKLIVKLLGKEQKEALYNHLRTEDGNVPIDALEADLMSIFNSQQAAKNS